MQSDDMFLDARKRCGLYVTQLLLEMTFASDDAVETFRSTKGLTDAVLAGSSYAQAERLRRRWIRYPIEVIKQKLSSNKVANEERPFLAAASVNSGISGQIQGSANQLLAAIGYNVWYPKTAGQRGLRILCLGEFDINLYFLQFKQKMSQNLCSLFVERWWGHQGYNSYQ